MTTTPTDYETALRQLGGNLADMLAALWHEHEAGRLTLEDFQELAALLVLTANEQAATRARAAISALLTVETGNPLPPVDAPLEEWRRDPGRIRDALATIAAGPAIVGRLARLAKAEPADAARATWAVFVSEWDDPEGGHQIEGWTRQLDADACELCTDWADGGSTFPATLTMYHHPGCLCVQRPVITTKGKP